MRTGTRGQGPDWQAITGLLLESNVPQHTWPPEQSDVVAHAVGAGAGPASCPQIWQLVIPQVTSLPSNVFPAGNCVSQLDVQLTSEHAASQLAKLLHAALPSQACDWLQHWVLRHALHELSLALVVHVNVLVPEEVPDDSPDVDELPDPLCPEDVPPPWLSTIAGSASMHAATETSIKLATKVRFVIDYG